ncbi:hypothetical protein QBC41DRAFT_328521 [Cercophora samala]|uniref:Uncharacterized protein n=1 Tax=Cercophora samala TaxID=330535 RepID=A0AA39Z635_9PEZI|nr:hypothetical protein QBC41DRAFT_328521 [Cercophora samala]
MPILILKNLSPGRCMSDRWLFICLVLPCCAVVPIYSAGMPSMSDVYAARRCPGMMFRWDKIWQVRNKKETLTFVV